VVTSTGVKPKLLRVLQERQIERLGSSQTLHVDFRLLAATTATYPRWLPPGISHRFVLPAQYFSIQLPLFVSAEDIHDLVWHFVARYAKRMNKRIEPFRQKI